MDKLDLQPCDCLAAQDVVGWVCNRACDEIDVYRWIDPFAASGPRGAARESFLATDAGREG